ncbi:MAG: signal recognition particle protein, partial [Actinomycetota bacterium]
LARVRERALSEEVMKSLTPAQQVIKVVRDELTATLGGENVPFRLPKGHPAVILMAGVQGSGKTTACAKLAFRVKEDGYNPLLVACDLARPAAIEQLFTLGGEIGVAVTSDGSKPEKVAKNAVKLAKQQGHDVVIVDTAGRLHVDDEMMREARRVKDACDPGMVLMSCDAMTGQDAVIQAREFMRSVDTTGFILTKLDGDARGGAALSITGVTGLPVYFAGVGEKPEDLEAFYPDRLAERILGMGDVLTLIEKAEKNLDQDKAEAAAGKMATSKFTLEDFLDQMRELKKMGSIQDLLGMMPGLPGGKNALRNAQIDEKDLARTEAIILSMTPEERRTPVIINGTRRARIAAGAGTNPSAVNALLKQFKQAQKMMKSMMGGKRMPNIPGMPKIPGMS